MFYHDDPKQAVIERGRAAQVMVAQTFWRDLSEYLDQLLSNSINDVRQAKYAEPLTQQLLLVKWRATEEFVQQVLNYPLSAIEQAKELNTRIA